MAKQMNTRIDKSRSICSGLIVIKNPKKCTFWDCPNFQQTTPILIQLEHKIKREHIFFLVNMPIPLRSPKKYTFR